MNQADLRAAVLRVVVGSPGPVVPESATWHRWVALAKLERVTPLLYLLVDAVPTDLIDEQRVTIDVLQEVVQSHCVRLEHHLIAAAQLLREHDIRAAVLKGAATAHLDYPDPTWREFSDVDLLVDPADLHDAIELLGRSGWAQGYALPRGHGRYAHAVTLVLDGMEMDLHQRVAHRALGLRVPTHELLDNAVTFEIAGSELHALGPVDRLIHSTLHMVSSRGPNRRLSTVADVLVAAREQPHTSHEVLEQAERWQVRPLVERGIGDAFAAARLEVDAAWADAMRVPLRRRDRVVERAYLGPSRRPVLEEVAYLRLLATWQDRWRYVRGHLAPDSTYASRHGRTGVHAQIRYLAAKMRSKT